MECERYQHVKVAIFGDIGGHGTELLRSLEILGLNFDTGKLPEDQKIIQAGDLIHKGPDSNMLVSMVDEILANNPVGQWTQIFGNHEMQHIGGYSFWRCDCSLATVATLQRWWNSGRATLATAVRHDPVKKRLNATQSLITHAGVTHSWWKRLGHGDAFETAREIRRFQSEEFKAINKPGLMLGEGPNVNAGPVWAHSTEEVYPSWYDINMPFNQIHGHTAPFAWSRKAWYPGTPMKYRKAMNAYQDVRVATLNDEDSEGTFAAIDPGFEKEKPDVLAVPFLDIPQAYEIL
jgi:Calcineurin-like phosphoesterase